MIKIIMLSLTSVSASKDDIGDVADEFMPPCQRVHAITVTVYMAAGDRTWVAGSQANRLDHSATAHRQDGRGAARVWMQGGPRI